jgi:hypothetical protein
MQDSRAYAQSRSCYHTERPDPESAFLEVFRVDRCCLTNWLPFSSMCLLSIRRCRANLRVPGLVFT